MTLFEDVANRKFEVSDKEKILKTKLDIVSYIKQADSSKFNEIDNMIDNLISNTSVSDGLENRLAKELGNTFYYVGINEFVLNFYKKSPDTAWKIKAVLQCGFPFEFADPKKKPEKTDVDYLIKEHLKNKKWSVFVFTKEPIENVVLGFDDKNTYANLKNIRDQRQFDVDLQIDSLPEDYSGTPFVAVDYYNEKHDTIIEKFLNTEVIPIITKAEYEQSKYSFVEIPTEYFRIDYLDYLSRYKKSVTEVFGYPEKNEKIIKLKNIVEFVNAPGKKSVYPDYKTRQTHVLIKDFFFRDTVLKPTVRIGEQNIDFPTFWEEYEIKSYMKNISPYYLYSNLTSELIFDYYTERYAGEKYYDANTPLPLEDCIFIEMPADKMYEKKYQKKYERDINPDTKAHDMIKTQNFNNKKAKESIEKFLVEIKNDIDIGSFYSATILMGSVLEAFLIDWLSEIDGKDYFSENYMIVDKKYNAERRADLKDYIDEIQKKRPTWISGAKKATEIRKKRNLVHAKLYITEGEVSKDICHEMIQNLESIINNRWNK